MEVLEGNRRHPGATIGDALHQALHLELADRLPDGDQAHPVCIRQLLVTKRRPGRQLTRDDPGLQFLIHPVDPAQGPLPALVLVGGHSHLAS